MIAAESNSNASGIAAGASLVRMALRVDAVLAAKFSHLAGPTVWAEVRGDIHQRLRALYAASDHQLRQYALAAMLATGSDDFSDILIPLLTGTDQQVRIRTHRSGPSFHPSSLGPDWPSTVATWTEDLRAEFASELTMHHNMIEVGLHFARSDPSLPVRFAALQGLSWMGQYDAVTEILRSLPDSQFEEVIQKFHREEIPPPLYP
jgi:HEAT repeat protein